MTNIRAQNPGNLINVQFFLSARIEYNGLEGGYNNQRFHELMAEHFFTLPRSASNIGDVRIFSWPNANPSHYYEITFGYDTALVSVNARHLHLDPTNRVTAFLEQMVAVLDNLEELKNYFNTVVCQGNGTELQNSLLCICWPNVGSYGLNSADGQALMQSIVDYVQQFCSGAVYGYRDGEKVGSSNTRQDSRYKEAIICEAVHFEPFYEPLPIFAKRIAQLRLYLKDFMYENSRIYQEKRDFLALLKNRDDIIDSDDTKLEGLKRRMALLKENVPIYSSELLERTEWIRSPLEPHPVNLRIRIDGRKHFPVELIENLENSYELGDMLEQLGSHTFYCRDFYELEKTMNEKRRSHRRKRIALEMKIYLGVVAVGLIYTLFIFYWSLEESLRTLYAFVGILADYIQTVSLIAVMFFLYSSRNTSE